MELIFLNPTMKRVSQRQCANNEEVQRDINQYIAAFYNPVRLHSNLGLPVALRLLGKTDSERPYLPVQNNFTATLFMKRAALMQD